MVVVFVRHLVTHVFLFHHGLDFGVKSNSNKKKKKNNKNIGVVLTLHEHWTSSVRHIILIS